MFVSIYYKPSLFNAHTMILIVHIFMKVNKLCLNQRGLSARRSSLKGRERAIVNQTNIGTVSRATLGEVLRDTVERRIMGFFERIDSIWN